MSDNAPNSKLDRGLEDHRDFPRLEVEAKVRIEGISAGAETDAPAIISDLSLGGARLASPAKLTKNQKIQLIPFAGLDDDHPLHRRLSFEIVWIAPTPDDEWNQYGLLHLGAVLDVLDSWLGHLLLRRKKDEEVIIQRRQHRRLKFSDEQARPLRATVSHDQSECELTLIDVAPGGLLARSDLDMPVGIHLEFTEGLVTEEASSEQTPVYGCVIDSHVQSGSNFYRVSFDPDSRVDESSLVDWALRLGGDLDLM